MRTLLLILMSLLFFLNTQAKPLEIGATIPPIPEAIDHEGRPFPLNDTLSQGTTLVFFYPKADTPGCTAQACSLRDNFSALDSLNVRIIGVSRDSAKNQMKFKKKHNLNFTLIADEKGIVTRAFGVPSLLGFAKRQSFLIRDGKVIWRDLNATTARHAQDILQALQTLGK